MSSDQVVGILLLFSGIVLIVYGHFFSPQKESTPSMVSMEELYRLNSKITKLNGDIYKMRVGLKRIKAMCGNPDAAEGCRLIIKKCEELLKGEV